MKNLQIVIHPGWGFSSKDYKKWKDRFTDKVKFFERGYFSETPETDIEKVTFSNSTNFNVLVAHSLGLHLLDKKIVKQASLLVIIGGFEHFGKDFKTKIALKIMKDKIKNAPKELLEMFYQRCFFPDTTSISISENINREKLISDLSLLDTSRLDTTMLKSVPKILIFHGTEDKIISIQKGTDLFEKISSTANVELVKFEDAGHGIFNTHFEKIATHIETSFHEKLGESQKNKIIARFSKSAPYYDHDNTMHKKAAASLADYFPKINPNFIRGPILEIGAGTGLVTQEIVKYFPTLSLEVTDISEEMLNIIKRKMVAPKGPIKFIQKDGEMINNQNHYGLIISGMTFQWFTDLFQSIDKLYNALKKGGTLLFSCQGDESFGEWKNVCENGDIPFTKNPLPKRDALIEMLQKYDPKASVEEKLITQDFASPLDFFHWLKKRGASQSTNRNQPMSFKSWKKLLSIWPSYYPDKTTITHQILIAKVTKE